MAFRFNKDALIGVYLGLRVQTEDAANITNLVKEKYENTKLYQCIPHETRIEIDSTAYNVQD